MPIGKLPRLLVQIAGAGLPGQAVKGSPLRSEEGGVSTMRVAQTWGFVHMHSHLLRRVCKRLQSVFLPVAACEGTNQQQQFFVDHALHNVQISLHLGLLRGVNKLLRRGNENGWLAITFAFA